MNKPMFFLLLFLLGGLSIPAQLIREDSVPVIKSGNSFFAFPFAGGMNLSQFSGADLDMDGQQDLFVFDREGDIPMIFQSSGTAPAVEYHYRPDLAAGFPAVKNWALLRDLDCDGKADLLASASGNGIQVWRNISTPGAPAFTLWITKVQTDKGSGPVDLVVSPQDIPAITDVDGDGDLDILTFSSNGLHVEYHINLAVENGNCANPVFSLADACWGNFEESSLSNSVTLGVSCKGGGAAGGVHAGSTLCTFDENFDGDLELLLGDLLFANLVYLRNGGSSTNAVMDTSVTGFPWYDSPVGIVNFPAAFYVDVDLDGKEDLLAAPNGPNVSENYDNIWYYKDYGSAFVSFSLLQKDFLQENMIDHGTGAFPVFMDYNGDGLKDLLVGNYLYKSGTQTYSGIALYENTGTLSQPEFTWMTDDYLNLSTAVTPALTYVTPAVADLDGDLDEDLILGDGEGRIHWLENTAGAGNPVAFTSHFELDAMDVGQFSAPAVWDFDGDGLMDLIVGEMNGNLNYFRNTGTPGNPQFNSVPDDAGFGGIDVDGMGFLGFSTPFVYMDALMQDTFLFVGTNEGNIFQFTDVNAAHASAFTLLDSSFSDIREGSHSFISAANIDSDTLPEWLIGNYRGGIGLWQGQPFVSRSETFVSDLQLHLWPNPAGAGEEISLRWPAKGQVEIKWIDLQGRLLQCSSEMPSEILRISAPEQAGIYLLEISDGTSIRRGKVVVAGP